MTASGQEKADRSSERGLTLATRDMSTGDVVERVAELLEHTYRSADLGNVARVLDETVYILLTLNTREQVYRRVYDSLRSEFPTWSAVAVAATPDLARILKPGGFQAQRTRTLQALLTEVARDNQNRGVGPVLGDDLTLEYLHDMPDAEAVSFLRSLPGVGMKSARCVLSYSLGRPSFAVDTHVERIFTRLGLVPRKKSEHSKVDHNAFESLVPAHLRKQLHINLVHHGRAVCQSTARCNGCVLVSFCGEGLQEVARPDAPVVIDLFAGAGGLGSGFRAAGFRVALAVEQDRNAAQTYRLNNPGVPVIEADVTKLSAADIRLLCPGVQVPDVVLAGPPCQGYSAAGARNPSDSKNRLFESVVKLAEQLLARLVVMENVPGLQRVSGVAFTGRILESLRRTFEAECGPLVASDFGVPQNRRRLFFVGRRRDLGHAPSLPSPTHTRSTAPIQPGKGATPRLEDRLKGDLELGAGVDAERLALPDGSELFNASTMRHSEEVIAKIAGIEPGKGPISYRRLEREVARTLVAGHRALPVHPWLHRTISVREAARIQGFDDSYLFCGPRANQPLQVANAVPPPVARALAEHLRIFLPSKPTGLRRARNRGAIQ